MENKRKITRAMRTNPEFEQIIKKVMARNLIKGKQVPSSRVTLAMARQYKKYPHLLKELEDADLK